MVWPGNTPRSLFVLAIVMIAQPAKHKGYFRRAAQSTGFESNPSSFIAGGRRKNCGLCAD